MHTGSLSVSVHCRECCAVNDQQEVAAKTDIKGVVMRNQKHDMSFYISFLNFLLSEEISVVCKDCQL